MRYLKSFLSVAFLFFLLAGSSQAATPSVGWTVTSLARPTSFVTTEPDRYTVVATNVGSVPTTGRVTVTVVLPAGVVTSAKPAGGEDWGCGPGGEGHSEISCGTEEPIAAVSPGFPIEVPVKLEPGAQSPLPVPGRVSVSGGVSGCGEGSAPACPSASGLTQTLIGAPSPPFGIIEEAFATPVLNAAGAADTQAGDHPGGLETSLAVPSVRGIGNERVSFEPVPAENIKQVVVDLPPGLVGNPRATPACSLTELSNYGACSPATRLGTLTLIQPAKLETGDTLFNVTPEEGYPAEFGAFVSPTTLKRAALLYAHVGSYPDYQTEVSTSPVDRVFELQQVISTFFGDPAADDASPLAPVPFFTNPSDCQASGFTTTIHIDTWQHPGAFKPDGEPQLEDEPNWKTFSQTSPPVTGCGVLAFHPTFSLQPTSTAPDSPSGLNVDLQVPQNEEPQGLATPPVKDVTVALPAGLDVSPSSATGLEACSDAQIELSSSAPGSCPPASQVGSVKVTTPLLAEPLEGQVFLRTPECDPCSAADAQDGRMIRLFIQLHSQRYGVTVKSPGVVKLNPATGQLTSTFADLPQQPFSDLKFKFKEGPRAPLSTPTSCGTYETATALTAWSTPYTPTIDANPSFTIAGCSGNPFNPPFSAGTAVNQAGQYSPLQLSFSRTDSEQDFDALEAVLPPGLSAKLAGVPQCGEAEIAAARSQTGECPSGSQIGTVTVAAGPGEDPFYTTGKVYLTGPYNGGPFGEAVVVPAVAGPFNLGNVVVRGAIRVNPTTAQGIVVSDPFPSILDGIPLQTRSVHVTLERPGFSFNATSCEHMTVTGMLVSTAGASAPLSSPYQTTGCQSMPFKPVFTVATSGKTSKLDGASLFVKITSTGGPEHAAGVEEANVAKVDLTIPNALPSRLTTLQKACTEAQFNANPAGCPAASDIATALVHTPLLANPLSGPVYFVSHGGAAFPDTEIVLQGEGVRLVLDGHTQIKNGVTYSRFESVPDAPFSSFEFFAPEGPYSIFGANGNLCAPTKTVTVKEKETKRVHGKSRKVTVKVSKTEAAPLEMPTTITAQNGAVLTQNTKIGVTGCPKAAAAKQASKAHKARGGNQK